jgi:hypothetical protein
MAILSFMFEQLFVLLVPELVVWFEAAMGAVDTAGETEVTKLS